MASPGRVLLRGGARRFPPRAGAYPGHLLQVQLHRRQDRRFFYYYTTYIKYGIGRTTYDAAQEIRNGEITLDEGKALCKKFDGEYPDRFEKEIFQYLSLDRQHFPWASQLFEQPRMDRDYFMHLADRFRRPASVEVGGRPVEAAPHPLRGRQRGAVGRPPGAPTTRCDQNAKETAALWRRRLPAHNFGQNFPGTVPAAGAICGPSAGPCGPAGL